MKVSSRVQTLMAVFACAFVGIIAFAFAGGVTFFDKPTAASVEIGLAEMSPKGASGGFAVPASGDSGSTSKTSPTVPPSFVLRVSPDEINQGAESTFSWQWSRGSQDRFEKVTVQRCAPDDLTETPVMRQDTWGNTYQDGTTTDCRSWEVVAEIPAADFAPITQEESCNTWGECSMRNKQDKSGISPSFDAETEALAGGEYYYRGVAKFNEGTVVSAVTQTIESGSLPDLIGIVGNYTTFVVGESNAINYGIRNNGNADAAAGAQVQLQFDYKRDGWDGDGVDGDFAMSATAGLLPADGGAQSFASSRSFSDTGDWRVCAVADPTNAVTESDEANNATACDDFIVTDSGPSVLLEARSTTDGIDWTGTNFTVATGNTVDLRWEVADASSCNSSNFNWNSDFNGNATPATQPDASTPVTYTLVCTDSSGNEGSDQVTISAADALPDLSATKSIIRTGEPFTLDWGLNGNDPAQCRITGTGSPMSAYGSITTQTGTTPTIYAQGTTTYTLECPGGSDTHTIQVLPEIFES